MRFRIPGLKKNFSLSFSTSSYPLPPGAQDKDKFERNLGDQIPTFNTNYAMTLSTVWACVRLISGTLSTLPIFIYKTVADDQRQINKSMSLYTLVHDVPNADMTAKVFWQVYIASVLLNGVGYAEKKYFNGKLVSINYCQFDRMYKTCIQGVVTYRYTDLDGIQRVIPREDLFITIGFSLDGLNGLSAIQFGARMFNSAQLAEVAANRTFKQGMMPTVAFSMEGTIKKDQRDEIRKKFREDMAGALNAGKPALLEGGMKAFPLGINPNDAQLLESRAWSVEEVCRWFGVPPFMVGHSEKSTSWGTGLEQQNLGFLTYCLRDFIIGIEQSINKDLMTPTERFTNYAEYSISALLRADSTGRAALYSSSAQNGWMTRKEIRQLENLPLKAGSDELTAQSNLLPLDKLGTVSAGKNLQEALKQFLEAETT